MNERVVEILVFIMNQIRGNKKYLGKLELLSQDLLKKGYSQNEISSAFSWLFERINSDFEEILRNTGPDSEFSYRVLHELESMIITQDAYGYLLQLRALGLMDDFDVEQVIERAMVMGSTRVDLAEMKAIIASILAMQTGLFPSGYLVNDGNATIH